jgi:heme ABC exporter ATP-binding subunit CcmA
MSDAVLQVDGVWKFFGDFPAVRNVSFAVGAGQCAALLGRNGAGKTTLLRMLSGLSNPSKGEVKLFGGSPREQATRRRVGMIGHGIGIYDELTASENLQVFARLFEVDPKRCDEWLERTDLARVKDGRAREFSRGMRQRLAIARAFLHDPQFLILDEPFTSLDDRAIALLQRLLEDALRRGVTVIMSTHQIREAMVLATHCVLLNRGQLAYAGERNEAMLHDPGWIYQHYGESAA